MGNSWNYELIFPETKAFTPDFFGGILDLASSYGYGLRYPTYVIGADGLDDLQFHDAESLTHYMCANGGNFTFWSDENDFGLSFHPLLRSISLGVDYNLRAERDGGLVNDLENIFSTICNKLQPRCGYSHDEWNLEFVPHAFDAWKGIRNSIVNGQPPPMLFWLNYFEHSYLSKIGEWRFESIQPHKVVKAEHGVFIYLADAPWNIQQALLGEDGKYHLIEYSS